MACVFVSYRRSDAPVHAGRLYDNFSARLGAENVFKDLDSIEPGADYIDVIEDAVKRSDAVIAVIGRLWLEGDRLRDPMDWVRVEIARAFERDIRVVPVLVDGGSMPSADALPRELKPLARRQAVELIDKAWTAQVRSMIDALEEAADRAAAADAALTTYERLAKAASRVVPVPEVSRARAAHEDAVDDGDRGEIAASAFRLGQAWERSGGVSEARAAYEKVVKSNDLTWSMWAREALTRLGPA